MNGKVARKLRKESNFNPYSLRKYEEAVNSRGRVTIKLEENEPKFLYKKKKREYKRG